MIDAKDQATQVLPLEEMPMKRKRGRPSTGTAMTPAEKQRAYRERQKGLRDQNSSQAPGKKNDDQVEELRKTREALEALAARQLQLEDELNGHFKRANKAEAKAEECRLIAVEIGERCATAETRVAELEKEVAIRCETISRLSGEKKKGNVTNIEAPDKGVWTVRFKHKGERKWVDCEPLVNIDGSPYTFQEVKENVRLNAKAAPTADWQAVRNDGLIYDPKSAK